MVFSSSPVNIKEELVTLFVCEEIIVPEKSEAVDASRRYPSAVELEGVVGNAVQDNVEELSKTFVNDNPVGPSARVAEVAPLDMGDVLGFMSFVQI